MEIYARIHIDQKYYECIVILVIAHTNSRYLFKKEFIIMLAAVNNLRQ